MADDAILDVDSILAQSKGKTGRSAKPAVSQADATSAYSKVTADTEAAKKTAEQHLAAYTEANHKLREAAPKPQETPIEQQWGSAAMAVAALGGLLSRSHATTALNAMSGVMNAYHQKDATAYQQAYQQWKLSHDALEKSAAIESAGYEKAKEMELRGDIAGANAMLRAHAAANRNQPILDSLDRGDYHTASQIASGTVRATGNLAPVGKAASSSQDAKDRYLATASAEREYSNAAPEAKEAALQKYVESIESLQRGRATGEIAKIDPQVWESWNREVSQYRADQKTRGVNKPLNMNEQTWARAKKAWAEGGGDPTDTAGISEEAAKITRDDKIQLVKDRTEAERFAKNVSALTPGALDTAARYYQAMHILPPGYGGQADRDAVMNRAAEFDKEEGRTAGEAMTEAASLKANQQALNALVKQGEAARSFSVAAEKELDLAVKLLPDTPEPLDNQLLTKWARQGSAAMGGTDVPRYMAALVSALDETAKVLSGATGAAGSTDASRAQAALLIPEGATSAQVPAIVNILKQSLQIKMQGYTEGEQSLKDAIRLTPSGGGAGAARPAAGPVPKPASFSDAQLLEKAGDAIKAGKPRQAIIDQLRAWGIDPKGL